MKKETLKECGKAVLNLANIIGGLSVINSVFTTISLSIPTIMIIIYTFVILYSGGLILIEKGEKND